MINKFLLKLIRFYQRSVFRDRSCRFIPTCSDYAYQAIVKYGTIKGLGLSLRRILHCHPFNPGGYDPLK